MNLRVDAEGHAVAAGAQTEIGGNDRYIALCRRHFFERLRESEARQLRSTCRAANYSSSSSSTTQVGVVAVGQKVPHHAILADAAGQLHQPRRADHRRRLAAAQRQEQRARPRSPARTG